MVFNSTRGTSYEKTGLEKRKTTNTMLSDDKSQHTIDSSADKCTVPMKDSAVQEFNTENKGSSNDDSEDTQVSKKQT